MPTQNSRHVGRLGGVVSRFEDRLLAAIAATGIKPLDSDTAPNKKNWNQKLSDGLALAIAAELRDRRL